MIFCFKAIPNVTEFSQKFKIQQVAPPLFPFCSVELRSPNVVGSSPDEVIEFVKYLILPATSWPRGLLSLKQK
jgi:hypothetical protein